MRTQHSLAEPTSSADSNTTKVGFGGRALTNRKAGSVTALSVFRPPFLTYPGSPAQWPVRFILETASYADKSESRFG